MRDRPVRDREDRGVAGESARAASGWPACLETAHAARYSTRAAAASARGVRHVMANIHSQKKRILRAERERLENRRYTSTIKTYFRRLAGRGRARATTTPPTPSTASSSRRSTRPSSAARCTATTARARSPARPSCAAASPPSPSRPRHRRRTAGIEARVRAPGGASTTLPVVGRSSCVLAGPEPGAGTPAAAAPPTAVVAIAALPPAAASTARTAGVSSSSTPPPRPAALELEVGHHLERAPERLDVALGRRRR